MRNIKDELKKTRKNIGDLQAPPQLEERLRSALDQKRRPTPFKWLSIAASIFLVLAVGVGMNYNAFAYYGKKMIGFDDITEGSLQEVNELGMGQIIGESVMLNDTTTLVIDGMMTDDNQAIVYYTLTDPTGGLDRAFEFFYPDKLTGWMTNNHATWSRGIVNKDNTEKKGIVSFDPPSPFAKKLTLHYAIESEERITGDLTFRYRPNEAIQSVVKQRINQTVAMDKGEVKFKSITASPMSTTVTGTLDVSNFSRIPLRLSGVKLVVDGETIPQTGGSERSSWTGKTNFEINYEGLPDEFSSIELHVDSFVGYKELNQEIDLRLVDENVVVDVGGEELWVEYVAIGPEQVEITIASEETFLLDRVFVAASESGERTELKTTKGHTHRKLEDGTYIRVRTMIFPTTDKVDTLIIGGIHYEKEYGKVIEVK
ncbi:MULTISPECIES: DUF4179 domain-containing protein [Bacillaceae]|uniref:DUF4179 domain-containing protein n=1 Tax=Evansella alkalicola TaxID=745819 RepID=A0ABS6JXA9_9BACI|nr:MULTISPECIES: DUF4179 domain-containing protein [Bacillaceae]MBU9723223.1 DUF4179 domain-containing protein [Bacillus alkalicola]